MSINQFIITLIIKSTERYIGPMLNYAVRDNAARGEVCSACLTYVKLGLNRTQFYGRNGVDAIEIKRRNRLNAKFSALRSLYKT
jgi:hypothetical protein